jgi:quercetin dioxygenase-like cupin family protein
MFGEHRFRFLATGEETDGSYGVMEVVSPEGSGPGPHTHEASEEHFLVLTGEVVFSVGGETFTAKPGDLVHVPRQTLHEFKVSASATMIATFTPAGDERGLREGSVLRGEA